MPNPAHHMYLAQEAAKRRDYGDVDYNLQLAGYTRIDSYGRVAQFAMQNGDYDHMHWWNNRRSHEIAILQSITPYPPHHPP